MTDSTSGIGADSRMQQPGVYLRLKSEFRALCAAIGGYEAAAEITRGTTATLHRHGDARRSDLFPAVDAVVDLEIATGRPLVTAFLAQLQGYRLEPLERRPASGDGPMLETLTVVKEVGDFASAVHEMEADGVRTVTELERAIREGHDAAEAIQQSLDTLYRLKAEALAGQSAPEA